MGRRSLYRMSKMTKILFGAIGVTCALALAHAWMNLGFDPLLFLGLKQETEVAEETRFRVGFLPVT
jgi:hypothetical protein